MSGIESAGEIVSGGLIARAVEPDTGATDGHTQEGACLNCAAPLDGPFCSRCGQRAHVHRTLGAFFHDLLHGVLHFEGKTWRTIPMLAWRPGDLTRRYIEGQRARFVSPIAIFLFSVFLMFAAVSLLGGPLVSDPSPQTRAEVQRDYDESRRDGEAELRQLQAERAEVAARGATTADIDRRIANLRRGMELQKTIFESMGAAGEVEIDVSSEGSAQGEAVGRAAEAGAEAVIPNWFDQAYRKAKENPSLLLYKIQANAYKFSWALIPISLPLVWLMFLHRRRYREFGAYDHTVFVTYSLAFMSLLAITAVLVSNIGLGWLFMPLLLFVPVHMYRQLKGAYQLSSRSALWRTVVLMLFSWVALALFGMAILMLGIS